MKSIRPAWTAWCVALLACGSSGGGYSGTYAATYSGTYKLSSTTSGVPSSGSNTATATITVSQASATEVELVWTIPPNPPSGSIDFALSGGSGVLAAPAKGTPTGGSCFMGELGGNTQTNCCTKCSITFTGDAFSQPNAGTFTGTTADGVAYSGTYSGTWIGTKE
jgi:hypothetical protein